VHPAGEVERRIRILHLAKRALPPQHFQLAAAAVLQRRRLHIRYYSRARDEQTQRDISPQRLVHYRENWYVDAWCHLREDIRSFAVDAIRDAVLLDQPALEVNEQQLDAVLAAGYGIFSGRDVQWAVLRFSPRRARWVAAEQWHPQQRARTEPDGTYVLEVPYSDPRELIMDILKHGPEVEVVAPPELRREVGESLRAAAATYAS
jgi:predicted DNA-binding transcriptional regulator YafY